MRNTLSWVRCSLCGRRAPLSPCRELELCPYCMEAMGCGGTRRRELLEPDESVIEGIRRRTT
ncbi:MAG: hypothetical protein NZ902_04520 [Acidilobaceae archaeon]|nr:hypothetical protein [Acidilobaceae archaeon]MCX8165006.1 hypothetical protein [Acidilobaceae archaeon]MDW7974477.1 hypothetical protein [Sulfolobales archaeon]